MSSSSSSTSDQETPSSSSSPPSQLHTFSTSLTLKLADDNFLIWRQQVLAQFKGLNLLNFLESSFAPLSFLSSGKENPNPLFLLHKQQDNLLVSWLLASMCSLLTKMVGLRPAYQIWDKLNVYFASNTRARVRKLKTQLKTLKRDRSISIYLLDIKRFIDSLTVVGSNVSTEDHLEAILDGLPEEYDSFITSVTSRLDPYTIEDIEALLLAQEERFDKHKSLDHPLIQANTASTQWNPSVPSRSPFRGTNLCGGRGSARHSFNKRQP